MNSLSDSPKQELSLDTSLTAGQETEDKDETISSTSTQDFDREKVGKGVHKPHLTLSTDW